MGLVTNFCCTRGRLFYPEQWYWTTYNSENTGWKFNILVSMSS
jgi:hypothetical protein